MKLRIQVEDRKETVLFSRGETLLDIIRRLGYRPDAVVLLSSGKPVSEERAPLDGDEITVLKVASGG